MSESENSEGEDKKEKYLKNCAKNATKTEEKKLEDDEEEEKLKTESRSELIFEFELDM